MLSKEEQVDIAWRERWGYPPLSYEARRAQLERIYADAKGICYYCSRTTVLRHPGDEYVGDRGLMATREHLIRKADGGTDEDNNIVLSCGRCNWSREKRTPDEHMAIIAREAGQLLPREHGSEELFSEDVW